jgi:hypothetical protein
VAVRLTLPLALLAFVSCAHTPAASGSLDDAQRTAEAFLHQLRWDNLSSASNLVVPSRRAEFRQRVDDGKLEDHLKVTEYELKEVGRAPDGQVVASSQITWYLEPSVTLNKETLRLHLTWLGEAWGVAWIEGGPIPLDVHPPVPDAGAEP